MTEKFKILGQYIKDMSSETPDIETFLFVRERISKYQLDIDIKSNAIKNQMIEVNTSFKFIDKEESKKKSHFEIIFATIIKVNEDVKTKEELEKMFDRYDVLLSPVLASPPVKIGTIDMNTDDMKTYVERLTQYSPFTGIFNQSGQPSMSVPLYRTKDNLPVGSMTNPASLKVPHIASLA